MKDAQATGETLKQPSKENIQHFKTWNFYIVYFLWSILALLDPDRIIADPDPKSRENTTVDLSFIPYWPGSFDTGIFKGTVSRNE